MLLFVTFAITDSIADYFDESGRQLEKEELIVEAAQTHPEGAKLLEKVDSGIGLIILAIKYNKI